MAAVEVAFTPLPAHVRTARLIAAAVARRLGIDGPLLDEVRLAVGEACSRAVAVHQRQAPTTPVTLTIQDEHDSLVVTVADTADDTGSGGTASDAGAGGAAAGGTTADSDSDAGGRDTGKAASSSDPFDLLAASSRDADAGDPADALDVLPTGFGLAVIAGLVDDLDVVQTAGGTVVRMTWKSPLRDSAGPATTQAAEENPF